MKQEEAYKILGISEGVSETELKKRYRELIALTHPDSGTINTYPFEAHDIIKAYKCLLDNRNKEERKAKKKSESRTGWNASLNPNAYMDRPVYQYVEDSDGQRIGSIEVARGKYLWIMDEDFELFLRSLRETAKEIIRKSDSKNCMEDDINLLSKITYLLAGQFFSSDAALGLMKETQNGEYYSKAMLELKQGVRRPVTGDYLIPGKVKKHRLFVNSITGNELGYLSFKDDRLLFGLVPLFERRAVQLKLIVNSSGKHSGMVDVDMWVRRIPEDSKSSLDSINIKIKQILETI